MTRARGHERAQILKSLETGLRVLGCFEGAKSEWGVTELAGELGVSKASVYRVLATLERHGYVLQDEGSGRYRLGSRLIRLGRLAANHFSLPERALPLMRKLRDETGEEVHLAVLDGREAVYIAKVNGLRPVQVASEIGDRCPAHCVSTGKVLLAHADPAVVEGMISEGLVCYTDRTHATAGSLLEELEKIRGQGYAVNWGEWREDVRGVAAPIVNADGSVVASIGICGPAFRLDEGFIQKSIPAVVGAASRLSGQLGAPEER